MVNNAELDRLTRDGEKRLARLRAITEELAGEQFAARSGPASAIVDGHGTLVDLRIADEALTVRTLELDSLNRDILEAITGARLQAAERAGHLLFPVFPALFSDEIDADRSRG
jgi:hypothetical protein